MKPPTTKAAVQKRIAGLPDDVARKVVCALVGHSRVQEACFGYFTCQRCKETVGDTLAGAYDASGVVIVGHDCETCRKNRALLTWKDTLLTPEAPADA